jgi:multidrug resistance efflux pump
MSRKSIFPSESIEFTIEYHLWKNTVKSIAVYMVIVVSAIAFVALLPFIFVEITVQADGLIRPVSEKTEIKPQTGGEVTSVFIREGQEVNVGDTLLILKGENIESKIELVKFQLSQTTGLIADLEILTAKGDAEKLKTPAYKQTLAAYRQKIAEIENRKQKAKKELDRNRGLFERKAISEKEFDDFRYNFELIQNELKSFKENTLSNWQTELVLKRNEKEQYTAQLAQYRHNKSIQTITAPVNGTIEQFSGIYTGTSLQAGQTIAVISPQTELIAEVNVLPKDIGYLSLASQANIQVHAYNYYDWGMLHGKVIDISNDYLLSNSQYFFRVRCKLSKDYLQLKNGTKGELKKGMTIRSRFIVNRRSLWQLLFDNVNNWMNPAQPDSGGRD